MFVTVTENTLNYLCRNKEDLSQIAVRLDRNLEDLIAEYNIQEIEDCENFHEQYKCEKGVAIKKNEADFYPENLHKSKQKKLADMDEFLDKIVMKINGIPVWFNDELVGSLKKTADNLTTLGHTTFPLILKEEMLFLPEGEQRTKILNTVFRLDLNTFKTSLLQMDIYAQLILLSEVGHKNKIKSFEKIEEVEAYDFTTGYPEELQLTVNFL